MRGMLILILICVAAVPSLCQSQTSKYQAATIMEVKAHPVAEGADPSVARYDISVQSGDTIYVVLYTPPPGSNTVEYRAGAGVPILVGTNTITFHNLLGQTFEVPILRREPVKPPRPK